MHLLSMKFLYLYLIQLIKESVDKLNFFLAKWLKTALNVKESSAFDKQVKSRVLGNFCICTKIELHKKA